MAKRRKSANEVPLMILTNERTQQKAQMILMLYKAASLAQLAFMDGMDPETGNIDQLLVGLEPTENGQFKVFPLAKLFSKLDEIPQYLVPDGNGNYIDYSINESLEGDEEAGPAEEIDASADGIGGTLGRPADATIQ